MASAHRRLSPPSPRARRSTCWRLLAATTLATVAAVHASAGVSGAEPEGPYSPPVDRPVAEAFRAPLNPYGPGNRGLDYATDPGDPVRASAAGEVTFAGSVAGALHVVVLHADGIRTSYSFLAEVQVHRGERVGRGQQVGAAAGRLHFGARAGERYLDPAHLLAGGPPEVHLVPVEHRRPQSEAAERSWLARGLGTVWSAGRSAATAAAAAAATAVAAGSDIAALTADLTTAAWTHLGPDALDALVHLAALGVDILAPLALASEAVAAAVRIRALIRSQDGCTPPTEPPPEPPAERRIVVLVGGLGSAAGDAAVLDVDTGALGYADSDRVQFSYRGGRAPGTGSLPGVTVTSYDAPDSMADIRTAGDRLRALLSEIAAAHPGVPVDLIAHSQGGLVVRSALGGRRSPTPVANVITLGSPHNGTDLATVAARLRRAPLGPAAGHGVRVATSGGVDPNAVSVQQMAETSRLIADLAQRPLPAGTGVTSIAADGDLVVPALQSSLDGATNVLVDLGGTRAHDQLPGSPVARREMALALGGAGPTCRSWAGLLTSGLLAAGISAAEQHGGGALVDTLPGP